MQDCTQAELEARIKRLELKSDSTQFELHDIKQYISNNKAKMNWDRESKKGKEDKIKLTMAILTSVASFLVILKQLGYI